MSKKESQKGKLKRGTRTDRYGQKPSLPVLPWEDEDSDENEGDEEK